jgi:hypothetical protein
MPASQAAPALGSGLSGNANDSIGTNNGTLVSGAGYAAGEVGQAFSLNGAGACVSISDSPSLDVFANGITIELWLKVNQVTANSSWMWIVAKGNTSWRLEGTEGAKSVTFSTTGVSANVDMTGSRNVNDGQWHHVAAVYDGTNKYIYVDGTLDVSAPATGLIAQNNQPVDLGQNSATTGNTFNGLLDEVSIYNRALSASEIQAIYVAGSGGKCVTPVPPTIITQPVSQTNFVGTTASFSITAVGTPPLIYQWNVNGTNIASATNATLTLTNVQLTQAGNYAVLVTNAYGSVISSNAVLTVNPTPTNVPVITLISPQSGADGTVVNITGLNFDPTSGNNTVYFGAVQAVVTAASVTNLTVSVPVGATFAPITETVNGLTAYANASFLPTFPSSGVLTNSSLGTQITLPTGGGASQMIIADFDGDGKPDLAVPCGVDHTVYIYRNISTNGTLTAGSFAPPVVLPLGTGGESAMVAADLTGDGKLDLVLLDNNSNTVMVLQNFCTPGNITTNSFGPRVNFAVGSSPRGIAVRDLDGDGKPEIVTANWGNSTISVLRNLGTTGIITTNSFAPAVQFASGADCGAVAIADLDGDGKPDVVTVNETNSNNGAVSVFRNVSTLGNIAFAPRVDFPGPIYSYQLAIGDMDGDGKLDVVFVSFADGQSVSVYRNTSTPGNITFASRIDFGLGGWGNSVALGDLDGHGKPDVAAVTQYSSQLSLFRNISTSGIFTNTSLAARLDFASGSSPYGVAIGDLDGDGRPDIVFANTYSSTISIYQNVVPVRPFISLQPASCTNIVGTTATFTVVASGSTPLTYQWMKNGVNIVGATSTNFIIVSVQTNDAATYSVAITNAYGSVISSNAVLNVLAPPTFTLQPSSRTNLAGTTATFTNLASGTVPLNYQWQKNDVNLNDGGNVSGSATNILTLANVQDADAASYTVVVTNFVGSITSSPAALVLLDPPTILSQPTNLTVTLTSNATFSVIASGSPILSYQWNFNGTNISGATNLSLTLTNVLLNQGGGYTVLVTNSYGSISSSNATLVVNPLLYFVWNQIPSPRFANAPFTVVIQAQNLTNGIVTNFTETVVLLSTNGVPINPSVSGNFIQGVWTGTVTIAQTATNLVLQATDNLGDSGLANQINVISLPALTTVPSGNTLLIFWPVNPSGFVLETTTGLSPANWVPVTIQPFPIGNQNLLPVQMSGTNTFYRLRFNGQ